MEELNIEKNYNKFIKYLKAYITRDGIDKLIRWLDKSDFAVAPASTRYHLCVKGGLVQHSLNVFYRLINLCEAEYGSNCPYSKETIALVALLHDISKTNFYQITMRNVKNPENGQWESVPTYTTRDVDSRLVFATHEENSLYMLGKFFDLTAEEECAIRWHGGSMGSADKSQYTLAMDVYNKYELATLLHVADLMATCIDENIRNVAAEVKPQEHEETRQAENTSSSAVEVVDDNGNEYYSNLLEVNESNEQSAEESVEPSADNDCPF